MTADLSMTLVYWPLATHTSAGSGPQLEVLAVHEGTVRRHGDEARGDRGQAPLAQLGRRDPHRVPPGRDELQDVEAVRGRGRGGDDLAVPVDQLDQYIGGAPARGAGHGAVDFGGEDQRQVEGLDMAG